MKSNVVKIVFFFLSFLPTKVMCVQYWPAAKDKSELYGDIEVKIVHEEELANFHIRTIKLSKYADSVIINFFFYINLLQKGRKGFVIDKLYIYIIKGCRGRAYTLTISLYRMAQSHLSFFKCIIRIP